MYKKNKLQIEKFKKIFLLFATVILSTQLCSCSSYKDDFDVVISEIQEIVEEDDISNYEYIDVEKTGFNKTGRSLLSTTEQGQYDILDEYIYKLQSDIAVNELTNENIKKIIEYYRLDNPQVFWLSNYYEYDYNKFTLGIVNCHINYEYEDIEQSVTVEYTGEMIEQMNTEIELARDKILYGIKDSMTDYEKVKYIHDYLAENVTYDTNATFQHNIYGALVEHKCVCDGYAFAVKYLLSYIDIECQMVYGSSLDNSLHAWNIVKIDDKYYHIDVTWDANKLDNDDVQIIYTNMLVSDEVILKKHNINSPSLQDDYANDEHYYYYIPIPECSSDDLGYYTLNEMYFDCFDTDSINIFLAHLKDAVEQKQSTVQFLFSDDEVLDEYIYAIQNMDYRFKEEFPYSNETLNSICSVYNEENIVLFNFNYAE